MSSDDIARQRLTYQGRDAGFIRTPKPPKSEKVIHLSRMKDESDDAFLERIQEAMDRDQKIAWQRGRPRKALSASLALTRAEASERVQRESIRNAGQIWDGAFFDSDPSVFSKSLKELGRYFAFSDVVSRRTGWKRGVVLNGNDQSANTLLRHMIISSNPVTKPTPEEGNQYRAAIKTAMHIYLTVSPKTLDTLDEYVSFLEQRHRKGLDDCVQNTMTSRTLWRPEAHVCKYLELYRSIDAYAPIHYLTFGPMAHVVNLAIQRNAAFLPDVMDESVRQIETWSRPSDAKTWDAEPQSLTDLYMDQAFCQRADTIACVIGNVMGAINAKHPQQPVLQNAHTRLMQIAEGQKDRLMFEMQVRHDEWERAQRALNTAQKIWDAKP